MERKQKERRKNAVSLHRTIRFRNDASQQRLPARDRLGSESDEVTEEVGPREKQQQLKNISLVHLHDILPHLHSMQSNEVQYDKYVYFNMHLAEYWAFVHK